MKRARWLALLLLVVVGVGFGLGFGVSGVRGQEPAPMDLPAFETMAPKSFAWEENPSPEAATIFAASLLSRQAEKSSSSQFGPQPLENWSRAVVQAISESGWDIYTFRLDGTDVRRLTDHPASDVNPSLNPAGTEIVFTSYRDGNSEIYKVAADGSSPPQRLTSVAGPDNWASWSPDGGQILFSSARHGQYELYVMNADGSNQHPIRSDPYSHDVMAVWDGGGRIYFARYGVSGRGAIFQITLQPNPEIVLSNEMAGLENLRIGNRDWKSYLIFDADSDNDGATELGAICILSCFDTPLLQILDSGSPNVDLLAGALEPINDPTREGTGILYSRLQFHTEGNSVYIDALVVERGEWTADNQIIDIQPVVGAAIASGWKTDDWGGPTLFPPDTSGFTYIGYSNDIYLQFDGDDPGGSGIQSMMVQFHNGTDWADAWSIDQPTPNGQLNIYLYAGADGIVTFRARGRDWMGNDGPWTETIPVKYFRFYLRSQAQDGHGRPVPNPEIIHTWETWEGDKWGDLDGGSLIRSYSGYQVAMQHPGFGSAKLQNVLESAPTPDPLLVPITPYVLPPKDSVFQNGNFTTDSLADWQIIGDPSFFHIGDAGVEYGGGMLSVGSYNAIAISRLGIQRTIDLSLLHKPVLGLYLRSKIYMEDDWMSVSIDSGQTVSNLLVITETASIPVSAPLLSTYANHSGGYVAYFFDLTPWQTESITLSLLLQAGGDNLIRGDFTVTSISLGSWTTPVVDSIAISTTQGISETLRFSNTDPLTRTLVLTGQNFLPGVKIKADTTVLKGVKRFGEERLEVLLPTDLPVGRHTIWVVNQDQTTAVLPSALAVGEQLYLPVVGR